jgi:hypothetical protein
MDRLLACLNDMGGFLDSNLSDTPTFFHHQFIMLTRLYALEIRVIRVMLGHYGLKVL